MSFWFEILIIFAGLCTTIFLWLKHRMTTWKRRGIPYIEPKFPYSALEGIGKKIWLGKRLQEIYNEYKNKTNFIGAYFFWDPVIIVTDLDLIKNILIKDFNAFHDHVLYYNEKDDPLSAHLFSLDGQKWKILRSKLTPTFTTGKMKFMYSSVIKVADKFTKTMNYLIENDNVIEMKDLLARFTTDVIGTCAFGIECNSLKDPNAEFRLYGNKMFSEPRHGELVRMFLSSFPEIGRFFHIKLERDDVSEFFMNVVRETIDYREKNNIRRNDFMDLLIQLKNTGKIDEHESSTSIGNLTFEEIAAQAYLFFAAGFETSSTTLSFCLYELALHQDIQDQTRAEINEILKKYDGQLTYEAMMEMTYVHKVIDETLRIHPPGTILARVATKDYQVPNSSAVIPKGTIVFIPLYGIHHDPDLYPDPEKFDPERFSLENSKNRHICAYLPFGEGPRNCIGLRFGKMQAYIGLITLLRNFKFSPSSKTEIPLQYLNDSFILSSRGGLFLKIEKIT